MLSGYLVTVAWGLLSVLGAVGWGCGVIVVCWCCDGVGMVWWCGDGVGVGWCVGVGVVWCGGVGVVWCWF